MKKIFKMSNLIPLLLVVYITKSFIQQPGIFDIIVVGLMSVSFLYKLKLDSNMISDKEELNTSISQFEEKIKEKMDLIEKKNEEQYFELKKAQDNDRMAAESKFSTLNLGVQRQSRTGQEKGTTYGWGNKG